MSVRNVEARIIKLEALQPAPSSPLDGMISDELTVMLLELYADVLASNALAEEKTDGLEFAMHAGPNVPFCADASPKNPS
ncbi:hypothetical protein [Bradyrhizobium sp. JYMT SZCCT0428]|uniref:hypothetical protein n=1 Tax=Bradyrhizobium sp. JYMT SZCCT0428 TaxID=2807673 RepID=UPI001BA7A28B|nr:hypothetical protein [Bradyrhizobium sp. JYMT SZCCT0428]MBR1157208.1 hypothetical protein [Bradyrhizobium sp. JYMT SZCCT0428]